MKFRYEGVDADGAVVSGVTEAETPTDATQALLDLGIRASHLRPVPPSSGLIPHRVTDADVATFCEQLAGLTRAETPLPEALAALSRDATKPPLRDALDRVSRGVREGEDLATLLERERRVFPPLMATLVRAGQASGRLSETLRLAAGYAWHSAGLRDRILSAAFYPLIVLALLAVIGTVAFGYVTPAIENIYAEFEIELSLLTQGVLFFGRHFGIIMGSALVLLLALMTTLRRSRHTPAGRAVLYRIPLIGRVLKAAALARFCRTMSTLLGSGLPLADSLDLAEQLDGARGSVSLAATVRSGAGLDEAMSADVDRYPSLLVLMIQSSQSTGRLPETMTEAAQFYEEETGRNLDIMAAILPAVFLFVAAVSIAAAVGALMLPMMRLLSGLGS